MWLSAVLQVCRVSACRGLEGGGSTRQHAARAVSPCFCSNVAVLGAGQYQLRRYVGSHKALIVIDGVEDECKLVRLFMAPVFEEPLS